jgi:hypothetical protein
MLAVFAIHERGQRVFPSVKHCFCHLGCKGKAAGLSQQPQPHTVTTPRRRYASARHSEPGKFEVSQDDWSAGDTVVILA